MLGFYLPDQSGRITMASRRKAKNGQKLKKGSFFHLKNLNVEMAPIGMIQETQKKKSEISDVVGQIIKKQHFLFFFKS